MRKPLILALLLAWWLAGGPAWAFETAARAAIIMDHRTGAVLFEKNADERIPPASMSKLMTAYMIFDRLKSGRLKLDEEVTVSERAWKMGGSQMFLKVGDRVRVEDLIRGIIIQSGNDSCVAMAEAISGSEEAFAREMDEKARDIGLTGSSFANSTGLDAPDHLMTVRDLALLARANSSSEPAIASAMATQASLPDWMMMPRIRSSTFTRSPTSTNICEPPIFQARSLTRISSSSLSLPPLSWSKIM